MTSTMSLALRICSSLSGGMNPAMPQGWPEDSPEVKRTVDGAFARPRHVFAFGQVPAAAGRWHDENEWKVLFRKLAGDRSLENFLLDPGHGHEECRAEIILLILGSGFGFLGAVVRRVQEGEGHNHDAGIAEHSSQHAQVILRSAKGVAAHEFVTRLLADHG